MRNSKFTLGEKVRLEASEQVYIVESIKRWEDWYDVAFYYVLRDYPGERITYHAESALRRFHE